MERERRHIRKDMAANIAESATTRRAGIDKFEPSHNIPQTLREERKVAA